MSKLIPSRRKLFDNQQELKENESPDLQPLSISEHKKISHKHPVPPSSGHGCTSPALSRAHIMPMSERQQIALIKQMSSPPAAAASPSAPSPGAHSPSGDPRSHTPRPGAPKRNERGETPLHVAAIRRDASRVQALLARGADVTATDYAGWTALHEACNRGHSDIAAELIRAGAEVNAKGLDDITPLHDACVNGHLQIVQLLLENGASVDIVNSKGETPSDVCRSAHILKLLHRLTGRSNMSQPIKTEVPDSTDTKPSTDSLGSHPSSPHSTPRASADKPIKQEKSPENTEDPYEFTVKDELGGGSAEAEEEATSSEKKEATGTESDHEDQSRKKRKREEASGSSTSKSNGRTSRPTSGDKAAKVGRGGRGGSCDSPGSPHSPGEGGDSDGPKVPPLKIVLPTSGGPPAPPSSQEEGEGSSAQQGPRPLPYVVPAAGEALAPLSPKEEPLSPGAPRVTRSQRATEEPPLLKVEKTEVKEEPAPPPESIHPRKRKMAAIKEEATEQPPSQAAAQPEHRPSNCTEMFLKIRKQIGERRKLLLPVQPKPPEGFKDYLMNRCSYVLAGNASSYENVSPPPPGLPTPLIPLYTRQEQERHRLRLQNRVQREKLALSVEQEILRVHSRAARALANQEQPFSACTYLKEQEVYNVITPEQEDRHGNARSRFNGRLFLSWLQDVDDKWEKIKESMVLRQQNEAESLNAVHKMDWERKMIELGLCDKRSTPVLNKSHVPIVQVSDFDLMST